MYCNNGRFVIYCLHKEMVGTIMKLAIVGSRTIIIENLADFLPKKVSEIVTGGAEEIDTCAAVFATGSQKEPSTL